MADTQLLIDSVADCNEAAAVQAVEQMLAAGVPAAEVVACCNQGMIVLGERFNRNECFLPDLMFGGMVMKKLMTRLEPLLSNEETAAQGKGTAVLGTVQFDVHDIGKDILAMVLRSSGFQVVDLGVDVPPEKFVEAIREHRPKIVGMSLLLTTCYKSVLATVEAITAAGLRDGISLMVGGAAASELVCEKAGCDFYGKTAVDGLDYALKAVDAA